MKKFNVLFEFLIKDNFKNVSQVIFDILADNMTTIAPTGNTREEDFECWYNAVEDGLKQKERQIILIKENQKIIGFFQYYIKTNTFVMEEVQIKKEFQGSNVFRDLFGFIITNIGTSVEFVEAYANKVNIKSMTILEVMGLLPIGMNKNGNSYHYKGEFRELVDWYKG